MDADITRDQTRERARLLFRSQGASPALTRSRAGVVLHEMAHMWFGDCATQ